MALTSPKAPRVCVAPKPLSIAPSITNTEDMTIAVVYLRILVLVAVPKIFPASLAPRFQPRNKPLNK